MNTDEKNSETLTSAQNSVYEDTPKESVLFNTQAQSPELPQITPQPELPNPITQPAVESPLKTEELLPPHTASGPMDPPSSRGRLNVITNSFIVVLLLLFGIAVGIGLRNFLLRPKDEIQTFPPVTPSVSAPTPSQVSALSSENSATLSGSWRIYSVKNGKTNTVIEGFTFELPEGVEGPVCDGVSCASQGTYLFGGTRFTIAPRGTGQVLPDYRGSGIADVSGRNFTQAEVTIAGRNSIGFSGDFNGTTAGGYQFTRMRGVMIPLSDTLSVEVNHFSPQGIKSDFAEDDRIFEEILSRIHITVTPGK